jgi:HEAT repeat protein
MSFLKKLFSSKQIPAESDRSEPEAPQADNRKPTLKELKKASKELIELKQPDKRGSDDQYEYEYSMYENAHDKIIARVKEIIKALEVERDVETLLVALKINDITVKSKTALALGRIGDKRAIEPLMDALGERYSDVKIAASTALGQIGDPIAVQALVKTMLEHNAMNVRNVFNAAQGAVEKIGNQDMVELFAPALRDDNHRYQCVAAEVLGNSGDARAVDLLIPALNDGDSGVRFQAAEALGKLRDSRAVEALISALIHDFSGGNNAAAKALGEIGDKRALEPLEAALPGWNEYSKYILQDAINKIRFKK